MSEDVARVIQRKQLLVGTDGVRIPVTLTTRVTSRPVETDPSRLHWHVGGWRCAVYLRISHVARALLRLGDWIDSPSRHR